MEPPSHLSVDIIAPAEVAPLIARLDEAVRCALEGHVGDVVVLVTDETEVQRLNREFRNLDERTDVLTFPSGTASGGDIAISLPDARRQASLRGVDWRDEVVFLAIHGALHLRGLDDETETERARMVDAMNAVARRIGLPPDDEWASLLHAEALS